MNKDLTNMFNDMSKEDLFEFLKECGMEIETVEAGKGGFYLDNVELQNSEIYQTCISENIYNRIKSNSRNVYVRSNRYKKSTKDEFYINRTSRRAA